MQKISPCLSIVLIISAQQSWSMVQEVPQPTLLQAKIFQHMTGGFQADQLITYNELELCDIAIMLLKVKNETFLLPLLKQTLELWAQKQSESTTIQNAPDKEKWNREIQNYKRKLKELLPLVIATNKLELLTHVPAIIATLLECSLVRFKEVHIWQEPRVIKLQHPEVDRLQFLEDNSKILLPYLPGIIAHLREQNTEKSNLAFHLLFAASNSGKELNAALIPYLKILLEEIAQQEASYLESKKYYLNLLLDDLVDEFSKGGIQQLQDQIEALLAKKTAIQQNHHKNCY